MRELSRSLRPMGSFITWLVKSWPTGVRRTAWAVLGAALALPVLCLAGPVRFAILGDYGVDDANELAVANLIKTNLQPEFIITCGDNQYGGAGDIDRNIGKYYRAYIGNYTGTFGSGASSNRFFPALGNHDYLSPGGYSTHLAYFTLPGNERYYDFVRGPVHFLIVNSEANEPDGTSASSTQGRWLSNRLAASASPWKLVVVHDPPYSSSGSTMGTRWPYRDWGASAVVSGDSHNYERIMDDGFPYFVNGAGGASLAGFGTPVAGSVVRYNAGHGAMLVLADERQMAFEFHSVAGGGTLMDRLVLFQPPAMEVTRQGTNQVRLIWATNGAAAFQLQHTATPANASSWLLNTNGPGQSNGFYHLAYPLTDPRCFFRLRRP